MRSVMRLRITERPRLVQKLDGGWRRDTAPEFSVPMQCRSRMLSKCSYRRNGMLRFSQLPHIRVAVGDSVAHQRPSD
jgi:hypothetical protein